jgi:hypothetical protein
MFFKLVSNISVEEHARLYSSYICFGIDMYYYCISFETVPFGDCSAL